MPTRVPSKISFEKDCCRGSARRSRRDTRGSQARATDLAKFISQPDSQYELVLGLGAGTKFNPDSH